MKILLHPTLTTSLTINLIAFHSSHIKSSLLYTIQTAYDISLPDHKYFEIRCVLLTFQFLTPRVRQILSVFERPVGFYLHCFCSIGPELLSPSLFSSLDSETIKSKSIDLLAFFWWQLQMVAMEQKDGCFEHQMYTVSVISIDETLQKWRGVV